MVDAAQTMLGKLPLYEILAVCSVAGCYVLALLCVRVGLSALQRRSFFAHNTLLKKTLEDLKIPLNIIIAIGLFRLSQPWLPNGQSIGRWTNQGETFLLIVALGVVAVRAIDYIGRHVQMRFADNRAALSLMAPVQRIAKILTVFLFLLFLLQNLGMNVTAVMAGLGIGGIAIALASQKSVENLFGGIMLATDQPVRIGDFCRYGDGQVGTIEDIGLRSVRVRTLSRTLVTIPNAAFVEMAIENFAARDSLLLQTTLGLRYETSPDQLTAILAQLRKLLLEHTMVDNEPARARFVGFGAYSLDIEIFAYIRTNDWAEFLAVREDIFLRCMQLIEAAGSGFAFPSQTLYMTRDSGLNQDKAKAAATSIAEARSQGTVPLPDWNNQQKAQFQDTLTWPPAQAAIKKM